MLRAIAIVAAKSAPKASKAKIWKGTAFQPSRAPSAIHRGTSRTKSERCAQHDEVQNYVSDINGHYRPHVGPEPPELGRKVITEASQKMNVLRFIIAWLFPPFGSKTGPNVFDSATFDPRHEPASDVAAARYRRQVIKLRQELHSRERLKDSQIECRASDAASGKGETD